MGLSNSTSTLAPAEPMYVDDRTGSIELVPLLRARGIRVVVNRMPFGDISFVGNGPDGAPVTVGIEVKKVRDILACITDGRFAGHQLPGLIESYQQVWLLVEGTWRPNPRDGILQLQTYGGKWVDAMVGTRRFMYTDLQQWLLTIHHKAGVSVARCWNWEEGVSWLSSLYKWWTQKKWEEHKGHVAINTSHRNEYFFDRAILERPTTLRMVAKELPGVGFEKSAAVADYFGSVENLVYASVEDIMDVPGIGRDIATRIWRALRSKA